jgi:hypothetical protein
MSTPAARRDAFPSVPCPRDSARRGPAGSPDLHDVHDTLSFLHPTQAIYLSASRPTRCGSSPFLARRFKPDPISNPHLPTTTPPGEWSTKRERHWRIVQVTVYHDTRTDGGREGELIPLEKNTTPLTYRDPVNAAREAKEQLSPMQKRGSLGSVCVCVCVFLAHFPG